MSIRVLVVFGTRPEAIKLAPVISELRRRPTFEPKVVHTGQHRELLEDALRTFSIEPDVELGVMTHQQDPREVLSRILLGLRPVLDQTEPGIVLVQGDTTTTLATALCAAHHEIPVGHVEAGLRTGSVRAPFPEEYNRRLATQLCAYHFPPTEWARRNLLAENVPEKRIEVTGNTIVDALHATLARLESDPIDLEPLTPGLDWRATPVILVTGHRRESLGGGFQRICAALERIAQRHPRVQIVYPLHLNPGVRDVVSERLGARANIRLLEPVGYLAFVQMMRHCHFILTDSGGIQEEAATVRKPVLVMRDRTERPEAVGAGVAKLVGTHTDGIVEASERLLADADERAAMQAPTNPFGDGRAAVRIVDFLERNAPLTLE